MTGHALWAVVFLAIGGTILATLPPVNSGWFLAIGATASGVGLWYLLQVAFDIMDRRDYW